MLFRSNQTGVRYENACDNIQQDKMSIALKKFDRSKVASFQMSIHKNKNSKKYFEQL